MTSQDIASLSLQPWAGKPEDQGSLADVLARVSNERGHFREITEASLQEEIAAEGALELSESEAEDESEDDADAKDQPQPGRGMPTSREELFKAKYEMLAHVRAAEQEILMCLDFVSLLLSKDAPRQAQSTISPVLKNSAPMGSLGTDVWQRMPADKSREAQDEMLATNVRLAGLRQSADSLLAAASRLETNVRKETRYWDQILSVSDAGWSVCRIPGDQHRLGVHFGFNESAREFSRRGLAALNMGAQGDILLERGIGTKPRAVHATLRWGGKIVGSSKVPKILDAEESTLEGRIRYARDSLFDEELYHEMIRESRDLASLGVEMRGSTIRIRQGADVDSDFQVSLDLLSLNEDHSIPHNASTEHDDFAQAIVLAAQLLLRQAHRETAEKPSQAKAPLPGNKDQREDERPILPILRPLMSFMMHRSALDRLNKSLTGLTQMFDVAGIHHTYDLARLSLPQNLDITGSEILVSALMQPWVSEGTIKIQNGKSDEIVLIFQIRTTLAQGFGSRFTLVVPRSETRYSVDNVSELVSATDAKLAAVLANALAEQMSDGWRCNENEALLYNEVDVGEKTKGMWVSVNIEKQALSLNSLAKKFTWRVDGESAAKSFWDAREEVIAK